MYHLLLAFSIGLAIFAPTIVRSDTQLSDPHKTKTRSVQGIVLVGDPTGILSRKDLKGIEGLHTKDLTLPGSQLELQNRLAPIYKNQPITFEKIQKIKVAIQTFYREYQHPFVIVELPLQDITNRVLQFVITESRLGEIKIEGNRYTSKHRLKRYISLQKGDPIDQKELVKDLNFINRNPFRRVDIIYSAGSKSGTTDVTLATWDRRPFRLYAGTDNTGLKTLGRNRWMGGFNWSNAFGLDHILSYQYTAGYNLKRFQAHTIQYEAPLYWHHLLNIYGGYSTVDFPVRCFHARTHGYSVQGSVRYDIPLSLSSALLHDFVVGFDFKRTNNTLEFIENFPRIAGNVNLTQLIIGYKGNYETNSYRIDFQGDLFWSPGPWLHDQKNTNFSKLRSGARNHWVYAHTSLNYLQKVLQRCFFNLSFQGQYSSQALLPSEQLGLGGYNTVRGYEERAFSADNGFLLSGELRSLPLKIIGRLNKHLKDGLQFLVFVDYGLGTNRHWIPQEGKEAYLLGIGPGARYTIDSFLTARLDWGFRLHDKAIFSGPDQLLYFSVVGSY